MAAVCSWHQRQMPRTEGSPQLAVLVTSLLGCAEGCRRWCSTSPLRRRIRILFLMFSMLSSPQCDRLPSVRHRAHPNVLVYVSEVAVRGDQVRAGLHRVCCDPDVVCRYWPSLSSLSDAMILE